MSEGASRSLKAFTLAEVLITLAIIGVVAALTIPTVVTNYKNQETATRLKKAYSTLANTTNLAILDNGPISTWEVENGLQHSVNFVDKYLAPYLKLSKKCSTSKEGICAPYKYFDLAGVSQTAISNASSLVLADGTLVMVTTNYANSKKRAFIAIDINGEKKPNVSGKDIFIFNYFLEGFQDFDGKFLPRGSGTSTSGMISNDTSGCRKGASGEFCVALIIKMDGRFQTKTNMSKWQVMKAIEAYTLGKQNKRRL